MTRSIRAKSLLLSALCLTGAAAHAASPKPGPTELVYIGTHGNAIMAARLDTKTGQLTSLGQVSDAEQPTWLVPDARRHMLYSVSELGNNGLSNGYVMRLSVDPKTGALKLLDKIDSGGGGTTHLIYARSVQALFAANYGSGSVSALKLGPDGRVNPPSSVQQEQGSGPSPRQKSAHAHGVALSPDGRFLLVTDLGADRIFLYRYDAKTGKLSPADVPFVMVPPGSGPRHPLFHPGGRLMFVNTELVGGLNVYRWNPAGKLELTQSLTTDMSPDPANRSAAEIALSQNGRFLYASNRGDNTIAVFAVDTAAGRLTEIQRVPTPGQVPWSFTIDPTGRWILVAEQASGDLAEFKIDPASGKLTATDQRLTEPSPVHVAIFPSGMK